MFYKYKDFKFNLNKYKKNELDLFIKYLNTNYSFFSNALPHNISFIDDNKKGFTYVKNIKVFIYNSINDRMDDSSIKEIAKQDNILTYLYRDYLFYEYDKNNQFNKYINGKDSNFILSLIAYIKYDDFNKIKDVVLNSNYARERLLNELNNELRVPLFNNILKINNNALDYRFNDLYSVIVQLFNDLDKRYDITNIKYDYSFHEHSFTNIDFNQLCIIFKDFLKYVDPSFDWLEEFNDCLDNKKIIVNKNKDIEDFNLSGIRSDKIILNLNGNMHDFNILAHEFAHHVSLGNSENYNDYYDNLIREFPSFYYERLATDFLSKYGVSDEEISNIKGIRTNYLMFVYRKISDLIKFSYKYSCDGDLSYDTICKMFKDSYKCDLSFDTINTAIDRIIKSTIITGTDNLQMVCYIMADYLLSMFDSNDLDKMKSITENLISYDYADIIDIARKNDKTLIKKK